MKNVTLFGPTIVMGDIRHPHENPLIVSNREAARLKSAGVLASEPEEVASDKPADPAPETAGAGAGDPDPA